MKIKAFFIALFAIAFSLNTQAQTATPNITKHQLNQQKRIKQGVKSGELTKKEHLKLKRQQVNIQKTKRAAKADGKVTRKERAVIKTKQKAASRNVYRKKHNARSRN